MGRSPYALVERLASMDMPREPTRRVRNADDMLLALADGADSHGRYFGEPALLRRLFWWEQASVPRVTTWLETLVAAGEVTLTPDAAESCYGGKHSIVQIARRSRFPRFANRPPVPNDMREVVYARDGYRCVTCGSASQPTLDHVHPWSRGGRHELANLQTMCKSCNSSKGARV